VVSGPTCNVSASRTTRRYSTAVARWRPSGENTGAGPVHLYVSEKSGSGGGGGGSRRRVRRSEADEEADE
jgi:hypothetical protein